MKIASASSTRERQDNLGQFLTPEPIADFMASMFGPLPGAVRLLDAGSGAGALTSAFVSHCCRKGSDVRCIDATLYELDEDILGTLGATLQECEDRCANAGILFTYTVNQTDFILEMSARLTGDLFAKPPPLFDAAIANPPYRKIGTESAERHALRSVGIETSNLYTGFIALIQRLLAPQGQLVAITPRSFCNGPYFRPFREELLRHVGLRRIHLFESRQAAFREDHVLQENIIFHAIKSSEQPREMLISSSSGEHDGDISETIFPFTDIVHPSDAGKFIHIPATAKHASAKHAMDGLGSSLASLGVSVSTGRVVDFRLRGALRKEPEPGTVPLLYPCHFNGGAVHWPKAESRKPNAILHNEETRQWLVPAGVYLLTKRFTSTAERRRLVACLFDPEQVTANWLGIENHLNYFHTDGHGLERSLAVGLYAFLNSTIVDQYFRRFSGHTQVNATDLRALKYPSQAALRAMGCDPAVLTLPQEGIDELVAKHLHVRR
ncbi:MAG: Eco57I restriction-modification methylase domain-containing protein [Opitutaceae bacterium]|nr:Eco57I restriction-modification methylase domain-containing protein [Opitutaceae bacterium]